MHKSIALDEVGGYPKRGEMSNVATETDYSEVASYAVDKNHKWSCCQ
jgi:hypothetical protein